MSYLEKKNVNGKIHTYFVKKVSFMKNPFTIKKYIGLDSSAINKEKYILDHIDALNKEEYNFRHKFLDKIMEKLSYSQFLPDRIELKTIQIKNYSEGKRCEKIVDTEFATEFIFNSNNIEGSKIPPDKVREIIETGNTKYQDKNEVKEVKNSIIAYEYIKKEFKFNLPSIKRLYHLLTKNLVRENKQQYPRGFKKIDNIVGNSATTPAEKVEQELKLLLKWYHENKKKIHPLLLAFEFHKKYEFIHPFLDGNGRTGRFIMNKILISNGYYPIIVYKDNKVSYFNAIEKSKEGKLKNYYQFMLEQANKTYDYLLEFIKKY
jgi:Fic family protein